LRLRHLPLSAGLLVGLLVLAGCRQDMHNQPRYKPLAASEFFDDGRSARPVVEGTVARGRLRIDKARYTGKVDGMDVSEFPFPITKAEVLRGQERFNIYCAVCHGAAAFGGSVIAENMGPPRPPSLRAGAPAALRPGALFRVITGGIGRMPAYAPQLTVEDRWAVIAYLERLRSTLPTSSDAIDDSLRALEIHRIDSVLASRGRGRR